MNDYKARQEVGNGAVGETERVNLVRLRKENTELKMDRAFLKKRRSSSPRKHRIRTISVRTDAGGEGEFHGLPDGPPAGGVPTRYERSPTGSVVDPFVPAIEALLLNGDAGLALSSLTASTNDVAVVPELPVCQQSTVTTAIVWTLAPFFVRPVLPARSSAECPTSLGWLPSGRNHCGRHGPLGPNVLLGT